ncbi:MAG: DUF4886 domain-containing protein [Clostridia bacterium]|nr:DUF4886 domain-containing protein [Clostridia bacterium]
MKTALLLLLAFLMLALPFCMIGCNNGEATPPENEGSPTPTPSPEDTAPPKAFETVSPVDCSDTVKILTIGNSFSGDALRFLYDIFKAEEGKDVLLSYLYIDSATLENHAKQIANDAAVYRWHLYDENGHSTMEGKRFSEAIAYCDWDLIVVHQFSGLSGVGTSFSPYLENIIAAAKENSSNENVKFAWQMTWAYQANSSHASFADYANNQMLMYERITQAVVETVCENPDISFVFPAGTAVQNARTSYMGDTLTKDGHHLSPFGKYLVGYTWYASLTGKTIEMPKFVPVKSMLAEDELECMRHRGQIRDDSEELFGADDLEVLVQAANAAVKTPDAVTSVEVEEIPMKIAGRNLDVNNDGFIKILAIGNSFSRNAFSCLHQIMTAHGEKNIIMGNLHTDSGSLERAALCAEGKATYQIFYKWDTSSKSYQYPNYSLETALKEEDWDIISLQQVSGFSGQPDSYHPHLEKLVQFVEENRTVKDGLTVWHMTWSYQQNANHDKFSLYNSDQMTMYNAICSTTQSEILTNDAFDLVVPSGTAIQNMRTSSIGDTLTADGYHLNAKACVIAGYAYYVTLKGEPVDSIHYHPASYEFSEEYLGAMKDAVNATLEKPFEVTQIQK